MTVGFVLDDTLDSSDGVQQYVITLGNWLTKQGHEVHYLVGQTERKDIKNVHSLSRNIKVTFNKNKMSMPLPARKALIRGILSNTHFDIMHVQMPYSPLLASKVINNIPDTTAVIGTFHILPFSNKERFATKILGLVLRKSLKRFNKIIAVSEPASIFAKTSFGIDSVVIPNLVDIASPAGRFEQNRTKQTPFRIVFVGRLVDRKGVLQLLDAFSMVKSKNNTRKLELIICGKGPLLEKVKDKIVTLGLQQSVVLKGFVTEQEKQKILSGADIAVFPSLGGESFGIVLIEAMAAGSGVVVGGDNPGYSSVLEDKRTLFDPKNTNDLAEMIIEFITNPDLMSSIHKDQRQIIKKYSVSVVGRQIEDLYLSEIAKANTKNDNV